MQTELSNYTAIIGIDWADKKHDVCIHVTATGEQELSQIVQHLRERSGANIVLVEGGDEDHWRHGADAEFADRMQSFELAFRMQSAVPELMDLDGESAATRRMYGLDHEFAATRIYARQCLVARRLVERGVPLVTVFWPNDGITNVSVYWDTHNRNFIDLKERLCPVTDRAFSEFEKLTGRRYLRVDSYQAEDADYLILGQGSLIPSAEVVAEALEGRTTVHVGTADSRFGAQVQQSERIGRVGIGRDHIFVGVVQGLGLAIDAIDGAAIGRQ